MSETTPTPTREQLIEEISIKLAAQPKDIDMYRFYDRFDETDEYDFDVQCTDGNSFDCYGIKQEAGRIRVWLYSSITDEFYTDLDNISTSSLQVISDEIRPPRTLTVTVQYRLPGEGLHTGDILLHSKTVLHDFTETELLQYLQEKFPTFDWQPDDEDQYVFYPDPDDKSHYFLGSCYRPDTTNEGSSLANSHYPVCN